MGSPRGTRQHTVLNDWHRTGGGGIGNDSEAGYRRRRFYIVMTQVAMSHPPATWSSSLSLSSVCPGVNSGNMIVLLFEPDIRGEKSTKV